MPTVLRPAYDVFSIQSIHIHHIEAPFVEGFGSLCRYFGKKCRVAVGHEKPEAFFEMMNLCIFGVGRGLCTVSSALTIGESVRWFF